MRGENLSEALIEKVLIPEEKIKAKVSSLGLRIRRDYEGQNPLFIGVLKGALVFLADLIRAVAMPLELDFMAVSSYGSKKSSSGVVRILKDLEQNIEGRHVIIVEDILDSGITLNYLLNTLMVRKPASLEICAFMVKKGKQKIKKEPKYVGFEIPNQYVIGYGLDFNEKWRHLPYIAVLKKKVAEAQTRSLF